MNQQFLQLGATFIIAIALIKLIEVLVKVIIKKYTKNGNSGNYAKMAEQLRLIGDNHLDSIKTDINTGNDRIVNAITNMHTDLARELGEIKGKLDK